MTGQESLLCAILDCGCMDLSVLDDVQCDWEDVIEDLNQRGMTLPEAGFNGLMRSVVYVGLSHLQTAINDRICELEAIEGERDLEPEEQEELDRLRDLSPYDDIESWHNYLDSSAYFEKNEDTYREYLQDALDAFRYDTGFNL